MTSNELKYDICKCGGEVETLGSWFEGADTSWEQMVCSTASIAVQKCKKCDKYRKIKTDAGMPIKVLEESFKPIPVYSKLPVTTFPSYPQYPKVKMTKDEGRVQWVKALALGINAIELGVIIILLWWILEALEK